MNDLAKSLQDRRVQGEVRRSMQHVPGFEPLMSLPDSLLRKLEELDRAEAAMAGRSANA